MSAVSHTYNAVMSPHLPGIYLFFPKSAQCLLLQGATSSLIPRHLACNEHTSSCCNVTVPLGTDYVSLTCIPSSSLDTKKVSSESSLIY